MKIPKRLKPLLDDGLIDSIISQLKSGKEAQVYTVQCGASVRCAKVYKEANQRSFKQAVQYQEGRKTRNSRRNRAMQKSTRYGQKESEAAWLSAEVDALFLLADAGVRVPRPFGFTDGVLLMELITDHNGHAAPRLSEVSFGEQQAIEYHDRLIQEVVRMLLAGLVHGDLSEFNVLIDETGPVIIDLPQAVNAAGNNNARMMLARDVNNMRDYFAQYAPALHSTSYAEEIWKYYANGELTSETQLTGFVKENTNITDVDDVMKVIDDALQEELERRSFEELAE